eukprot:5613360-Prymnesium_polylepis.1
MANRLGVQIGRSRHDDAAQRQPRRTRCRELRRVAALGGCRFHKVLQAWLVLLRYHVVGLAALPRRGVVLILVASGGLPLAADAGG